MINYNKIDRLLKERGVSQTYICKSLGYAHTYLADAKRLNRELPEGHVRRIAQMLGTSYDYLTDATDDPDPLFALKEDGPAARLLATVRERVGEMSPEQIETLTRLFELPGEELRTALDALGILGRRP